MDTHENLERDEAVPMSSDRAFGLVMTVLLAVIGLFPLLHGNAPRLWLLATAAIVLCVALVKAKLLAPLHKIWFLLGRLLHHIVSPIIMAVIYFLVVTPTGLVMRAMGKNPLGLHHDPQAKSYWIKRDPPGPLPESMENQF